MILPLLHKQVTEVLAVAQELLEIQQIYLELEPQGKETMAALDMMV
jgi:hypothetical protein